VAVETEAKRLERPPKQINIIEYINTHNPGRRIETVKAFRYLLEKFKLRWKDIRPTKKTNNSTAIIS
jgi:hypothetical protein